MPTPRWCVEVGIAPTPITDLAGKHIDPGVGPIAATPTWTVVFAITVGAGGALHNTVAVAVAGADRVAALANAQALINAEIGAPIAGYVAVAVRIGNYVHTSRSGLIVPYGRRVVEAASADAAISAAITALNTRGVAPTGFQLVGIKADRLDATGVF
jgi:hypothetical protein